MRSVLKQILYRVAGRRVGGNGDGRGGVGRRHVINKVMRFAGVGSEMSSSQVQFTPAARTTQLNKAPKAQAPHARLSPRGFIKFNNVIY